MRVYDYRVAYCWTRDVTDVLLCLRVVQVCTVWNVKLNYFLQETTKTSKILKNWKSDDTHFVASYD